MPGSALLPGLLSTDGRGAGICGRGAGVGGAFWMEAVLISAGGRIGVSGSDALGAGAGFKAIRSEPGRGAAASFCCAAFGWFLTSGGSTSAFGRATPGLVCAPTLACGRSTSLRGAASVRGRLVVLAGRSPRPDLLGTSCVIAQPPAAIAPSRSHLSFGRANPDMRRVWTSELKAALTQTAWAGR